jgi:ketosteroid isomerase-like protein
MLSIPKVFAEVSSIVQNHLVHLAVPLNSATFECSPAQLTMAIELIQASEVGEQAQLDLVNKYSELRKQGDSDKVLSLVTEDIVLESALFGQVKGKDAFKAHLSKHKTGESEPAQMVSGIAQCRVKAKIVFVSVSFLAKFQIIADPTSDGCLIEKIVVGRG